MALSWNLQNMLETPFPSFISKKPSEIPIFGTFFGENSILPYIFPWKSAFSGLPCLKTSLWRHTLADFQNFGINEKGRPSPILWYHTPYFGPVNLKFMGVVTTPLRKMCYGKYLRKTRVKRVDFQIFFQLILSKIVECTFTVHGGAVPSHTHTHTHTPTPTHPTPTHTHPPTPLKV